MRYDRVLKILMLLLFGFDTFPSFAQTVNNDNAAVKLHRCSEILRLVDSNFAELRQKGRLKDRLDDAEVYIDIYSYSDSLLKVKMMQDQLEVIQSLLHSDPHNGNAWLLKGNLLYKLDRSNANKAIDCYNKAYKYDEKEHFDAAYNIGCIKIEKKKYKEANKEFLHANSITANDKRCVYNLAASFEGMEKPDSALYWYMATDKLEPYYAPTFYHMGLVYGKQKGLLDSAIVFISKAISLDSGTVSFYEDLGVAYGIQGKYDDAINVALKCLEKFPDYIPALNNLVISYGKKGDEAAAEIYKEKRRLLTDKKGN